MSDAVKPRRLGRVVLVASLALNVLLAGAILGSFATGRAGPPRGFDLQIGPLGQLLSKEQRREVGRDLRRAVRDAGIDRPDRRAVMAEVTALLEADTFDQDAFEAVIVAQYAALDGIRDVALATFGGYLAELPVADRREIAQSLQDRSRKGGDRNGKPGNGGGARGN